MQSFLKRQLNLPAETCHNSSSKYPFQPFFGYEPWSAQFHGILFHLGFPHPVTASSIINSGSCQFWNTAGEVLRATPCFGRKRCCFLFEKSETSKFWHRKLKSLPWQRLHNRDSLLPHDTHNKENVWCKRSNSENVTLLFLLAILLFVSWLLFVLFVSLLLFVLLLVMVLQRATSFWLHSFFHCDLFPSNKL